MNKKLTILITIAAFVPLQAAEQHHIGDALIEKIPLETTYVLFEYMSPKDLSNYAATNKANRASATDFALRQLIKNLGLPPRLLGESIPRKREAIDAYLRKNFDITIILNNSPAEYRLYLSPFQALDIFNADYAQARRGLQQEGLDFLFDADLLEKTTRDYPHEPNHPYVLKISLATTMEHLKAIPPFSKKELNSWRKQLENELKRRFMDLLQIDEEAYQDGDIFNIYWDSDLELFFHNTLPRSPLQLLPRSIWFFNPQFFTCAHASLRTIPSWPTKDNHMQVNYAFNVQDNFISQLPATLEALDLRYVAWIKLKNNRLTYQPQATNFHSGQTIPIPMPHYKMSLYYMTH